MKLPFLLNSIARAASVNEVENVFSKLLKVLPQLEGSQVSNALNLLSKKEVKPPLGCWKNASKLLLAYSFPASSNDGTITEQITSPSRVESVVDRNPRRKDGGQTTTRGGNGDQTCHLTDINDPSATGGSGGGPGRCSVLAGYDIRDAIIILNAFSKVDIMPPELMRTVVDVVMRYFNKVDPHELSTVIHTLGKHGMVDEVNTLLKGNQDAVTKDTMRENDYSMILRVLLLNRNKLKESHAFEKLVGMIDEKCNVMSDKSMAILVNSLGRFGSDERVTLPILTPLIVKRLKSGSFNAMCISQIANGVARLNYLDHDLMAAIARRTSEDLSQFNTRCKVTVLNAFHKLDHFNSELFRVLVTNLISCHADMTPQCIANTVAAVSHFSKRLPKSDVVSLFKVLCHKILHIQSLQQFTMQNQVNILNGLSKVGIHDTRIYERLGDNILQMTQDLKPIDVACILNAFARARMKHTLVTYICERIGTFISGMKVQELTCCLNSVNNLRKCHHTDEDQNDQTIWMSALKVMADHLVRDPEVISRFRPLDVRLTIATLSDGGIVDRELYARLLKHLETNLRRTSMWDLVSIFKALVKIGYIVDVALLDAIEHSLDHIGICKDRGRGDVAALRLSIEQMGLQHPLLAKLASHL